MAQHIQWLDELESDGGDVGGKADGLAELVRAGVAVPDGFVITTPCYRAFLEETGIRSDLDAAIADDTATNGTRARDLIESASIPDAIAEEIVDAFDALEDTAEPYVAVRSSAVAEDLPDASFAGQQETFLNVDRSGLLAAVRSCWASLFTARAMYYRRERGYADADPAMAVVVQRMVYATKSGVLFTKNPSTGRDEVIVEASWGLGEAVVSGTVTPDTYVINAGGDVRDATIGTKSTKIVRDAETGATVQKPVSPEQRERRVLSDEELDELAALGKTVEEHFGTPQDVEWAIEYGSLYALQSRPITTADVDDESGSEDQQPVEEETPPQNALVSGIGASPGKAQGRARIVTNLDELDQVQDGEILVTTMTTPDMIPAMQRAVAIVTDEGGLTSHASIVSRELQVPAVVGTDGATDDLHDGQWIAVDGGRGVVTATSPRESDAEPVQRPDRVDPASPGQLMKPLTGTQIKVNLSVPEAADRAAATGADGVGLLRIEHLVLGLDQTPASYIDEYGADAYEEAIAGGIRVVAEAFYPRPVRVRTLDAPTDEFRRLQGGESEPHEDNPMLGYRGIRRSLDMPIEYRAELGAFTRLFEMGYDNIELMLPFVNDPTEISAAKELIVDAGIDLSQRSWGVMIETPASAICIDEVIETGIDFVSFGTNDLTQFTLAIDRNNERLADRYSALHPAVTSLMADVIEACRAADVETSVCGQAGSDPEMVEFLVEAGISSISTNIDAVESTQEAVMRVEQRLLLESVR